MLVDRLRCWGIVVAAIRVWRWTAACAAFKATASTFGAAAKAARYAKDDRQGYEGADDNGNDDRPSGTLVSCTIQGKTLILIAYLQYAFCMQLSQPENVCFTPPTSLEISRMESEALIARPMSDREMIMIAVPCSSGRSFRVIDVQNPRLMGATAVRIEMPGGILGDCLSLLLCMVGLTKSVET